jgi:TetR/AcrR family transcriptional regulator, mexJK operon transcriptional repressor
LLRGVLDARVASWSSNAAAQDWTKPLKLDDRLKFYATALLRGAADPEVRAFRRLATSAWPDTVDAAKRLEILGFNQMAAVIEKDVRDLGAKQNRRAKNPRRVAETLMAMLFGWLETGGAAAKQAEGDAFAATAVDILLHGKDAW